MDLYKDQDFCRQVIMDNYEHPNKRIEKDELDEFLKFNNNSDSCIDNITIFMKIDNNIIKEMFFSGVGCAISTSSSNIICNLLIDKTLDESSNILINYSKMIKGEEYNSSIIGDLNVFNNISKQPNRIKCSSIGSDACKEILRGVNG